MRKSFFDEYEGDVLILDRVPAPISDVWTDANPVVFRGYNIADSAQFWPVFFYRFVGPAERSGPALNYAHRIGSADVTVLSSFWVIYHSQGNSIDVSAATHRGQGGFGSDLPQSPASRGGAR